MLWAGALIGIVAAVLLIQSRGRSAPSEEPLAPAWRDFRVVQVYPHDPQAFVQGLIFRDGFLYESTGLNGQSSLRKVRLESGEVLQKSDVEEQHFAEGLTDFGNRLFQLTWQSNVGFVYAHGRVLKKVSSDILIDELFFEIDKWIAEGMHRPKRLKMAKPAALAMAEASLIPLGDSS